MSPLAIYRAIIWHPFLVLQVVCFHYPFHWPQDGEVGVGGGGVDITRPSVVGRSAHESQRHLAGENA